MSIVEGRNQRRIERDRQVRQAEDLLSTLPQQLGVAKGLFWGRFIADWIFPYPRLPVDQQAVVERAVAEVTAFCDEHLDPARIDREADIPQQVIEGLASLGVLGMTAPAEFGGRGFPQQGYGRILEVIGGRCSSTAILVNAHHSIGMRALLLFGTDEQKRRWLPEMASGRKLGAFALTEPEAGSDAANVQTRAIPSEDGSHYRLTGQKRYITNGSIADVLTVMARTPVPGRSDTAITAFLVTPDLPGFKITQPRMEKLGIRGTATATLEFENMPVAQDCVLGPLGKGLKVALTVLDFGRTTFGACCMGAAKTCLRLAVDHARTRKQFGRSLAEFELVQQKLARMSAWTYAMEAMTMVTASLIDRGLEDYMLETAMLKVWSTERLWTIVNDAFQIHGGAAYFTELPLERMLRDHRIDLIGEGANDVLLSFIALTGMRGPGLKLKEVYDALHRPWSAMGKVNGFLADWGRSWLRPPQVPVQTTELQPWARRLSQRCGRFGRVIRRTLIRHREEVLERQLEQERLAWAAMELFASACVLSRLDSELQAGSRASSASALAFLSTSLREFDNWLMRLGDSNDQSLLAAAREAVTPGAGTSNRSR